MLKLAEAELEAYGTEAEIGILNSTLKNHDFRIEMARDAQQRAKAAYQQLEAKFEEDQDDRDAAVKNLARARLALMNAESRTAKALYARRHLASYSSGQKRLDLKSTCETRMQDKTELSRVFR